MGSHAGRSQPDLEDLPLSVENPFCSGEELTNWSARNEGEVTFVERAGEAGLS